MTEQHERRVSHTELRLLAFICKGCKAELTLDWRNEEQRRRLLHPDVPSLRCPFCATEFDRYFRESFRALDEWRKKLETSGQEIVFRIQDAPT